MPDTKLAPHFWLSEFTASQTAVRRGFSNEPGPAEVANLRRVATLLEAARVLLGAKPISINSGYRCHLLNAAVGGAPHSAHVEGRAADFVCPGYGTPLEICQRLSDAGLPFDKLIMEGAWVHIQVPKAGYAPRKQVFTAHFGAASARYTEGL